MRPVLFYTFGALVVCVALVRLIARRTSGLEALGFCLLSGSMIISGMGTEIYNLDFVGIVMLLGAVSILAFNPRRSAPSL